MDLPPPPLFRDHHHLRPRYGNLLHPPVFSPPHYTHHLPPPPQPRLGNALFSPPPLTFPPPLGHMENPDLPPRPPFSPPRPPITESSHPYELYPPPKPYFYGDQLPRQPPPQPPPHPRENLPLRLIHDYPDRNPIFGAENFRQYRFDKFSHELSENCNRNLPWGTRGHCSWVSDIGDHEIYRNTFYQSHELFSKMNENERIGYSCINDERREFFNERAYEQRRWDCGIRGLDACINDWGRELYNERDSEDMRWDHGISSHGRESYGRRDYGERIWDTGTHDPRHESYCDRVYEEGIWGCVSNDGDLLRSDRQHGYLDSDFHLGGSSGMLGRVISKGPNIRPKKKQRVQRISALDRIPLGKASSSSNGGYKSQHLSKESFRGKGKEEFQLSGTRTEDKKEREQSPVELAISFKSNALVAKAILGQSHSASNADICSSFSNMNSEKGSSISDWSSAKSNNDKVKTDLMTCGLDFISDSQGTPIELLDKGTVSGSGIMSHCDANVLGEKAEMEKNEAMKDMNLPDSNSAGSCQASVSNRLRKKRKARKHKKNVCIELIDANNCINSPSAAPQLDNTTISKGYISSASVLLEPGTFLFPSSGGIVSEKKDDIHNPFFPDLKRKRSSLATLVSSLEVDENVIKECSGHAEEGVIGSAKDADLVCQSRSVSIPRHARESFSDSDNIGSGDKLGLGHDCNVKISVCDWASVVDSEKRATESTDGFTRLDSSKLNHISNGILEDGPVLKNAFVAGPSGVMVSVEVNDVTVLSRPQETPDLEVQDDKCLLEIDESHSALQSDRALVHEPDNIIVADTCFADSNSKEFLSNQVNFTQFWVHGKEMRNLEGVAVADSSTISLCTSTISNFPTSEHKGFTAEFDRTFVDTTGKKPPTNTIDLSCKIGSVEGSPNAINSLKTCLSMDSSPEKKRKARGTQMNLSDSRTSIGVDTVVGLSGNDPISTFGEEDSLKEDDTLNEGHSGVDDLNLDVGFCSDGFLSSYRKKRKVASPRLTLSSPAEDGPLADDLTIDSAKLGQVSTRIPGREAYQQENTPPSSFVAFNEYGTTNMGSQVSWNSSNSPLLDNIQADGNKLHETHDVTFIANNHSGSSQNGICAPRSDDEFAPSCLDMPSCPSSPEDLLSYTDFNSPWDSKEPYSQSKNEMICGVDRVFNRKPLPADANEIHFGKSLKKAASDNLQSKADMVSSLPLKKSVIQQSNLGHGTLILGKNHPKNLPGHTYLNFCNSRKLSSHVPKSRTWHRTDNSTVTVAEPKIQPSQLPHIQEIKNVGTFKTSYVRKGNSLVRKPPTSGVAPPGTDNLKKHQASVSMVSQSDSQSLLVNSSGGFLNHSEKSLNCNLAESMSEANPPRNVYPPKSCDALEEAVKSSALQTGSANNVDGQRILDDGNAGRKIMYVKKRSNQLVAASDSDDTSLLALEKNASPSDCYYKRKKNQLVRATSGNHVLKGDAMVNPNSCWIGSQAVLSGSTSKRHLGSAKTNRCSKFSFVWKLRETSRSSEKPNNLIGTQKVWPCLLRRKRATYWRSYVHALGSKPNDSCSSTTSQKLLLSRKRGAIYTRSTHGYSLRMSKVLSVGGSNLKWSKSMERASKKANEEATRSVAAAEKRKKEAKSAIPVILKKKNHDSRKSVLRVNLHPGERIFRIGSERYKMDPTRRTLHRITGDKESSSSVTLQTERKVKRSYIPRRLLIGNDEYVRIGNGNQLIRDPKKRTRLLASERIRWSLRTARLRLAKRKKYCQFFTRFGKCNKDEGKCPYIHDPSKIVVCTKFLNGSCSDLRCKLTHKVIPERMQDCSYFLKGSCSNDNCPYRHVKLNADSTICESFLRGYCGDGNECRKKHTYVCPAYETTGSCPQASACKLHHPKKKMERKSTTEQKVVRPVDVTLMVGLLELMTATATWLRLAGSLQKVMMA